MNHERFFAQCLEGKPAVVKALYKRIQKDNLHHNVVTLLEMPAEKRTFAEWSMGCIKISCTDRLKLETEKWEAVQQRQNETGVYCPGFILLETLWHAHQEENI